MSHVCQIDQHHLKFHSYTIIVPLNKEPAFLQEHVYVQPHMVLILWENYDYIPESKMQTQNASLTMCTSQPICGYVYICMLVWGCDCMYMSMCELVSICILFRSSVLVVWWSLKHGNPGLISYPIPLWSTNGDPGNLRLELAQGWNYRTRTPTNTHMLVLHIHTDF